MIYRIPPADQSEPKFPQPERPEAKPAEGGDVVSTGPKPGGSRKQDRDDQGRSGQRSGRQSSGSSRKKLTEMTPDELKAHKSRLTSWADRMPQAAGGINAIIKAIDANDLAKAQQLTDSMMKNMMGGSRGRRPGGSGRDGD